MSRHFLLSRAAKTLTLAQIMQVPTDEAEKLFARICLLARRRTAREELARAAASQGAILRTCAVQKGPARWRCKACNKGIYHHERHVVRLAQDAGAVLTWQPLRSS